MLPKFKIKGDKPKLIICDGAGTLFDPGSVVPAYAFESAFKEANINTDMETIMKYMGREKIEHIELILTKELHILEQFKKNKNRNPKKKDAEEIYEIFKQKLYPSAEKTKEIPGVKEAVKKLKEAGIPLVMTTGYDRKMVDETKKTLPWIDDVLTGSFTNSDVTKGRPAPYMIYKAMELAGVINPAEAIKIGDSKVDVEAADNAGMPGIIVLSGSVKTKEEAEEINRQIGIDHEIAYSLAEVIEKIIN